jgi:hypothetical protein
VVVALGALAALAAPATLAAQEWPAAGMVAAAGVSKIDSRSALGVTAGLTRSWGPVVGSLLGDLAIFGYRTNPLTVVDPLNGLIYCGSRRVNNVNTTCQATVDAVAGVLAEIGVALGPVVVSRGYRFSPVSESYFAATLHGSTRRAPIRWIVRGAAGARAVQVHAGVVIDLELAMP